MAPAKMGGSTCSGRTNSCPCRTLPYNPRWACFVCRLFLAVVVSTIRSPISCIPIFLSIFPLPLSLSLSLSLALLPNLFIKRTLDCPQLNITSINLQTYTLTSKIFSFENCNNFATAQMEFSEQPLGSKMYLFIILLFFIIYYLLLIILFYFLWRLSSCFLIIAGIYI
jgi:hypothetical protein